MLRPTVRVLFCVICWALFVRRAQGLLLDLTTDGASGSIDGAIFRQFTSVGGGSGHINAFLRIQKNGIERGYNRGAGPAEYDEKTSATFRRSLMLSTVPVVVENGIFYLQFLLDINQNVESFLPLDVLKIALQPLPDLYGYSDIF